MPSWDRSWKYDEIKEQYCKDNDINLIIIPYNQEEQINAEYISRRIEEIEK